jgi:hypothetical protein
MSSFLLDAHIDGRKIGLPTLDIALSLQTKEKTANKTNIYIALCSLKKSGEQGQKKKNIYLFMLPERWTQEDVFAASLRVVSHDPMKFVKNWSV